MVPSLVNQLPKEARALLSSPHRLFLDSRYFLPAGCVLLALETVVLVAIILHVPYTEIDWVAYMQEVGGVINGTFDYTQLKGDTGPLVYPAGFVYIYSLLYYITDHGEDIRTAQFIFAGLYLINLAIVLATYNKLNKSEHYPPFMLIFLGCTAYRVHSIFVLRLFNDPVAMLLLYVAVLLFINHHWSLGCVVYSLAVSVKMNILLFAPGLLVLLLLAHGWEGALFRISLCALIQLVLGAPFLFDNPTGYMSRAFDLGRQFFFKWTVNWRFLPEWLFLHRGFHVVLLGLHLAVLAAFAVTHWTRAFCGFGSDFTWYLTFIFQTVQAPWITITLEMEATNIAWVLFTSNFIGMCFSRSLHYQFYVWYFHSLPFLLWSTRLHPGLKVLVLLVIEYSWNVYPSTIISSLLLHLAHLTTLAALFLARASSEKRTVDSKDQ